MEHCLSSNYGKVAEKYRRKEKGKTSEKIKKAAKAQVSCQLE